MEVGSTAAGANSRLGVDRALAVRAGEIVAGLRVVGHVVLRLLVVARGNEASPRPAGDQLDPVADPAKARRRPVDRRVDVAGLVGQVAGLSTENLLVDQDAVPLAAFNPMMSVTAPTT